MVGGGGGKVDYYERAMDDASLVRAAREGDRSAFAGIYDRYADSIYSFLVTVVRNRDDAADLLQDTFLTAGSRLHQLRDPARLRPWLYAIARHLAMKSLSRSGRQQPLDDVDVVDAAPGPQDEALRSELAALIEEAAAGLGAQDRVVLDLHLRQGLEGQELGEALGVGAGHAYVMLTRMRDQVERSLGALLVARQGSRDCSKLAGVLKDWDGRFSPLWRKRVARHVDKCDACSALRKRIVSPASMLGVLPLLPAPAHARDGVLDRVQLMSSTGRAWPESRGGFPPPMARRRRRVAVAAVAAAIVLLLLAVPTVALVTDDSGGVDPVEPTGPPEFPLEFPDDVFKSPEPLPEQFQPIEVPEPVEAAPANPGAPPAPVPPPPARPAPRPVPPAVVGQPGVVATPSPSPPPPPGPAGTPGTDSGPGTPGRPGRVPPPPSPAIRFTLGEPVAPR